MASKLEKSVSSSHSHATSSKSILVTLARVALTCGRHSSKAMTNILTRTILVSMLVLLAGGCGESPFPEATGKGDIRGINAIPNSQSLQFRIEERQIGSLSYEEQSTSKWDNISYNLNFDVLLPGTIDATRLTTTPLDVVAETQYTLSIIGSTSAPEIVQWEQPLITWEGSESTIGVAFGHLAGGFGALDIYFAADGIPPSAGAALASLPERGFAAATELPAGDYVVAITPGGDPTTIIFESNPITYVAAASYSVVLFEPDASSTSPIGVRLMNASDGSLPVSDRNSLPLTRVLHSAFGTGNLDLYINGDFTAPIIADAAFGQASVSADTSSGATPLTFTPTGNPGVSLLDGDVVNAPNSLHTLLYTGVAPDYSVSNILDNPRSVETFNKFRVFQGSSNFLLVDVYVVETGIEITDRVMDFFALGTGFATEYRAFAENTYDIIITETGTKNVLASQTGVLFTNGGITEFVVLDTADPNVLDLSQIQ